MPVYKNQHYNPQFYLKFFSNDTRTINIFIKKSEKVIRDKAEIKHTSSADYFYSKDVSYEKKLGIIEDEAKRVLEKIILSNKLPEITDNDTFIIYFATIVHAFRTKQASHEINQFTDKLYKANLRSMHKFDPQFKKFLKEHEASIEDLDSIKINSEEAAREYIYISASNMPSILDLKIKLLENRTDTPFLTSDHPVVFYNRFLERRNIKEGTTSLSAVGLQIFYPISPKLMLFFYDSLIYQVGLKNSPTEIITDKTIIDKLNVMQFLNCGEFIYFNKNMTDEYLHKLNARAKKFNTATEVIVRTFENIKERDGSIGDLNQLTKRAFQIKLDLSFIKETTFAKKYKVSTLNIRKNSLQMNLKEYFRIGKELQNYTKTTKKSI